MQIKSHMLFKSQACLLAEKLANIKACTAIWCIHMHGMTPCCGVVAVALQWVAQVFAVSPGHTVSLGFFASPNPVAAISAARAAGKGTSFKWQSSFCAHFVTLFAMILLVGEAFFLGRNVYTKLHLNVSLHQISIPYGSDDTWSKKGSCTAVPCLQGFRIGTPFCFMHQFAFGVTEYKYSSSSSFFHLIHTNIFVFICSLGLHAKCSAKKKFLTLHRCWETRTFNNMYTSKSES